MEKEVVDELYHQLRLLYLSGGTQEKEAIMGITSHLTQVHASQGDYTGLLRFLTWYGESFLLQPVYDIIAQCRLQADRIVELGAGFGWLGRGVARMAGNLPTLFIDKRQWPLIDIVADIESTNGRTRVLDELKAGDLIVMSELLHCLNDPAKVLLPFYAWPIVAIEYHPMSGVAEKDMAYLDSYNSQIERFDCRPIVDFASIFPRSKRREFHRFPHTIVVAEPL